MKTIIVDDGAFRRFLAWKRDDGDSAREPRPEALREERRAPGDRPNTRSELAEKKSLDFEEGATEVWFCERDGAMHFFHGPEAEAVARSVLVPESPTRIG